MLGTQAAWRPVSYIAKQELFVYPGVRHFLAALGGIPLDRGNPVKTRTPERREVIHFYGVDERMEADPLFVL